MNTAQTGDPVENLVDHRVGHFWPPSIVDGLPKLRVLQGLRCFSPGWRIARVADARQEESWPIKWAQVFPTFHLI